jgi:hypothetical protein
LGATDSVFVDGTTPDLVAADLNGFNLEQKNLIEDSEQVFDDTDREQQSKAVSNLVAKGNFRGDSGAADAYVLEPTGNQKRCTALMNGQTFIFQVGNTNTGASTVAVDGLTSKAIKNYLGNDLAAGELTEDDYVLIIYDSVNEYFVLVANLNVINNNIQFLTDSITAYAGGGQANAVQLTTYDNIVTVCATSGDSVKLDSVFAVNTRRRITNNGDKICNLYPASGDDLGEGVDTAYPILPGNTVEFIATTANSAWKCILGQNQKTSKLVLPHSGVSWTPGNSDCVIYRDFDGALYAEIQTDATYSGGSSPTLTYTGVVFKTGIIQTFQVSTNTSIYNNGGVTDGGASTVSLAAGASSTGWRFKTPRVELDSQTLV